MIALALACASPAPSGVSWRPPDTDVPSDTGDTGDTGAPLAPPVGWGTCGVARAAIPIGTEDEEEALALAAGSGRTLAASYDGPLPLGTGEPLVPAGERGRVVARYDDAGALLWAVPIQGDDQQVIEAVAEAEDGGAWVVGSADGLTSVGDGPRLPNAGESDALVLRLDADGAVAWATTFGSAGEDRLAGVAVLAGGDAVVGGWLGGETAFGADVLRPLDEETKIGFLARFAPDGALVWARVVERASTVPAVTADAGGFAVAADGYVARYDGDGVETWSADLPASGIDGVALAPDGAVLVAGTASDPITFPDGEAFHRDAWLARWDVDGAFAWARGTASEGSAYGRGLAVAADGEALLAGGVSGRTTLGEPPIELVTVEFGDDGWLARYAPDGTMRCALQLRAESSFQEAIVAGVAARADGRIELAVGFDDRLLLGERELAGEREDIGLISIDRL